MEIIYYNINSTSFALIIHKREEREAVRGQMYTAVRRLLDSDNMLMGIAMLMWVAIGLRGEVIHQKITDKVDIIITPG